MLKNINPSVWEANQLAINKTWRSWSLYHRTHIHLMVANSWIQRHNYWAASPNYSIAMLRAYDIFLSTLMRTIYSNWAIKSTKSKLLYYKSGTPVWILFYGTLPQAWKSLLRRCFVLLLKARGERHILGRKEIYLSA